MRLFTAVDLSREAARHMEELQKGCRTVLPCQRWQKIENMHLTLHFLGEVEESEIPSLQSILREVTRQSPAFFLEFNDWGAFPNETRPRVIWIGVKEQPALLELQRTLAPALQSYGYAEADKPYVPHITMGRNPKGNDIAALRQQVPVQAVRWKANALVLYQSVFGAGGVRYRAVERFPLTTG
ncbi:RNA 2',3'-cyclic phosphodiesterase [Xylanibacillus composti]|uniref:RNA 2',3'-cyclic phosphodiesterase n=1 Tax=Xylanibacillus composti TaxID=1572762 RepID=A0A8J4M2F2_9BACL|nr:RNA 2',3'-cyclic phosphodiesterase [Xylanibacillus composti]GIQ69604.1 RNA 2',3'-cyclic phosphodiesterase [Xylanibacillus composti]